MTDWYIKRDNFYIGKIENNTKFDNMAIDAWLSKLALGKSCI